MALASDSSTRTGTAARLLLVSMACIDGAKGFPTNLACNTAPTWSSGNAFNQMNVATFSAAGTSCVIQGLPIDQGFVPCQQYTITVVSKQSMGHKIAVAEGLLGNLNVSSTMFETEQCRSMYTVSSSSYVWQAPGNSSEETIHCLCGQFNGPVWALTETIKAQAGANLSRMCSNTTLQFNVGAQVGAATKLLVAAVLVLSVLA